MGTGEDEKIDLHWQNMMSNLPDNIYWTDLKGIHKGCNDQQLISTGLNKNEFVGKNIYELGEALNWDDKKLADKIHVHNQQVMQVGRALAEEEEVIWRDGKKRIYLSRKIPIKDNNGNCAGLFGISTDITCIKDAERNAQVSNKAKNEFLIHMAHDVKTPLVTIVGLSKLLTQNLMGENFNFAHTLLKASQELLKFFNSCIEITKLECDDIPPTPEIFDFKSVIDQILYLFQPAAKNKNLNIEVHYDEKIPRSLLGNRNYIYRILLNLVSNAVKFTEQGSITIRAALSEKSTVQQAILELKITDTGVGIPKDKHSAIFQRFTRLNSLQEGNGVGLYIVKKLVDAMGGSIQVDSREKEGSEFVVILPLQIQILTTLA